MMLMNTGMGTFYSPNSSSVMNAVGQAKYGVVSGFLNLVRNSANVVSIAIATTVVVATMGSKGVEPSLDAVSPEVAGAFVAGLKWAFLMMAGLLMIGIVLALFRGERPKRVPEQKPESITADSASD